MLEKDGKLYFCTSNKKKVYDEIKLNPYIELTYLDRIKYILDIRYI
ncbi:hypothetical protein Q2T46_14070 [Thermoanaerobacterium sp. CMT5567-10]|nr:hypothetical protein [Thermoanaerobacterium sp. CMT5567-10]WKV08635.1 hypothetical protein Q2T46_14070 [Thermoanaerobacterium sp. CMT5567-10]